MGYEELIASLESETEAKKREVLQRAGAEAERILQEARREAAALRRGPRREAERRLSVERARRLQAAALEAGDRVQEAKREILGAVVDRSTRMLEDFTATRDYERCLEGLLAEAADGLPGGTVYVRSRDWEKVNELAGALGASFEVVADPAMPPGLKVVSRDGLVEVDNTFPTRLSRYLSSQGVGVSRALFSGARRA